MVPEIHVSVLRVRRACIYGLVRLYFCMAHNETHKAADHSYNQGPCKGVRLITYSPPLAHPATKFPWRDDHTPGLFPPLPWLFAKALEPLLVASGKPLLILDVAAHLADEVQFRNIRQP
jgi:hypothetical protein